MTNPGQKIFLSYSREDVAFARELRDWLLEQGHAPWMDLFDIPAGARWPTEIDRALKTSDAVIGLMSPAAVASENVMNEWDWAIANDRRLILLLVEPCDIPFHYVSRNYIDCVTDPQAGLASLEAAMGAQQVPPVPEVGSSHTVQTLGESSSPVPIVGRQRELHQLRQVLERALRSEGRLVLVSGEPGIGKTRLVEWLAVEAGQAGATTLWGRCYEGEGAPAFWPWSQILRTALSLNDPDAIQAEVGADVAHLAQILPEIESALPDLDPIPPMNPEQARFRLFDAVTRLLKRRSNEQPSVVIFEDLHWADAPTLLLLQFLAQELRGSRLLVLGTYRNVEVQRQHPLSATLASLVREPVTERITLRRFTPEEVAVLIEHVSGAAPAAEMAEAIWRETEGNPFFVTEVVRLFDSGEWSAASGDRLLAIRIPESIRDVVGQRLDRLTLECNELLAVAAVVGRNFDLSTLEAVTDKPAVELLPLLDEAAQSQITEAGEHFGQYRFSHRLIQETLYDELPTSRRFQLHSQIGASLEERHAADLRDHYGILAHHYSQAPLGPNIDKAIDYATKAAEQAMRQVAWEEAVSSFKLALQLLELQGDTDPLRKCDLLLELGTAHSAAGSGRGNAPGAAESMQARVTFWEAVSAARSAKSLPHLVRAAFGLAIGIGGVPFTDYRVVPLLEEIMAQLPETDSIDRALTQSLLAAGYRNYKLYSGLRVESGSPETMHQLSSDAISMADRLDDPFAVMVSRFLHCFVIWHPDRINELRTLTGDLLRMARSDRFDQYDAHSSVLVQRFLHSMSRGDVNGAKESIEESIAVHQRTYSPRSGWMVKALQAGVALSAGRFTEAERRIEEQNAIWPDTGIACNQFVALCRETGRMREAESSLRRMLQTFPGSPWFRVSWILFLVETGQLDEARHQFSRLDIHDLADLSMGAAWPHVLAICAELSTEFNDTERARVCYDLLEPYPDHIIFCGYIVYCPGSISYYLGLLAGVLREWQKAEAHFEQALEQHQAVEFHPLVAHTRYAYADMLQRRGNAGDRYHALELLDQALQTAQEIGMIRLERLAGELHRRIRGTTI